MTTYAPGGRIGQLIQKLQIKIGEDPRFIEIVLTDPLTSGIFTRNNNNLELLYNYNNNIWEKKSILPNLITT